MSIFKVLNSELQQIIEEAKKKHNNVKEVIRYNNSNDFVRLQRRVYYY